MPIAPRLRWYRSEQVLTRFLELYAARTLEEFQRGRKGDIGFALRKIAHEILFPTFSIIDRYRRFDFSTR